MVTCPHCSQEMNDAPELAGQFVACPHCGQQFPLAPPAPRAAWSDPPPATPELVAAPMIPTAAPLPSGPPPPPSSRNEFAFDTSSRASRSGHASLSSRVANEYRRAKKSATKLPKFILLAATIIWPIAALGWGQVRYQMEFVGWKHNVAADVYFPNGGGEWKEGATMRMSAGFARFAGMVHVTMLYGFTSLACLAWWFYVKD